MLALPHPFIWHTPAETRLPLGSILYSLVHGSDDFEADIKAFLHVDQCILACSGRALLALLLESLARQCKGQRTEVLIPGYTCYSVAASVVRASLSIRVYDLDPHTLLPDLDSVKKSLSGNTLAIVGQHLFGIPCPMGELLTMARRAGAVLIDDAAQGLGGSVEGKPLGTLGDYGIFSFGRGKPLPLGGGGALVGKDVVSLSSRIAGHGGKGVSGLIQTTAARILSHKYLYGIMETLPVGLGKTEFNPGFGITAMPEMLKRLGRKTFRMLGPFNQQRLERASLYAHSLDPKRVVQTVRGSVPVYNRFPFLAGPGPLPHKITRLGIRRMYPHAIAGEPSIRPFLAEGNGPTPGAEELARDLVTLPTHVGISRDIAGMVATAVHEVFP